MKHYDCLVEMSLKGKIIKTSGNCWNIVHPGLFLSDIFDDNIASSILQDLQDNNFSIKTIPLKDLGKTGVFAFTQTSKLSLWEREMVDSAAGISYWKYDLDKERFFFSEEFLKTVGLKENHSGYSAKTVLSLFDKPSRKDLKICFNEMIKNQRGFSLEGFYFGARGEKRCVRLSCVPKKINEKITSFIGFFRDITDSQKEKIESQKAGQRLKEAIESLPDGLIYFNENDEFEYANKAYREMYSGISDILVPGASFEAILRYAVGKGLLPQACGQEEDFIKNRLKEHASKEPIVIEQKLNDRWIRIIEKSTDHGGKIGLRVDITETKNNEARLNDIINATGIGIWQWNIKTNNLVVNQRWFDMFGIKNKGSLEVSRQIWLDIIHPDDIDILKMAMSEHIAGHTEKYDCQIRARHRNGNWVWVRTYGRVTHWDTDGNPLVTSGISIDVTSIKDYEKNLENTNSKLRATLEAMPDIMLEIDIDGLIHDCGTRNIYRLTGVNQDIWGKNISEFVGTNNACSILDMCSKVAKSGETKTGLRVNIDKNDSNIWFEVSCAKKKSDDVSKTFILIMRDISIQVEAEEKMREKASRDGLTNLLNREIIIEELQKKVASGNHNDFAFILVDLDYFKEINDFHGHIVGDAMLRVISQRLTSSLKKTDMVARLGGDEFAIIVNNIKSQEDLGEICKRLLSSLMKVIEYDGVRLSPSISMGVAFRGDDWSSYKDVYSHADHALYEIKDSGRGAWKIYEKNHNCLLTRRKRLLKILPEIKSDMIKIKYDPFISCEKGWHLGFEAVPFFDLFGGIYDFDEIIDIAEECDAGFAIMSAVIEKSAKKIQSIINKRVDPGYFLLPMSIGFLRRENFEGELKRILIESGISASRLKFMINESSLGSRNDEIMMCKLKKIDDMGFGIILSDFGSGSSSLSCLTRYPFEGIRLDEQMTREIALGSERETAIMTGITALASGIGMYVMASGADDDEMFEKITNNGCSMAQGNIVSIPLSKEEDMIDFIEKRHVLENSQDLFII